ncbi:MAG TPA: hypothetical protein VEQ42_01150 [Pyrinomonadaceae bacterium]|nr:hypothetical protein [Pyrinomonadaceae bacterium]
MSAELEDLRRRFATLRDEELLKIVTVRRAQYRQAALSLAEEELTRRGVAYTTPGANFTPAATAYFVRSPAPPSRGTAFWLGLLLIGCVCYWAAGMADQFTRTEPGEHPGTEALYEVVRFVLVALISLAGGFLMKFWESVD